MEEERRITRASAKARGRGLQNWVCEQIAERLEMPWGKDELIASREGGQTGTDVRLLGYAREAFPYSIECKNQETWSVPAWIRQAKENRLEGTDWLLILKRNYVPPVVVMDAERFIDLIIGRFLQQ